MHLQGAIQFVSSIVFRTSEGDRFGEFLDLILKWALDSLQCPFIAQVNSLLVVFVHSDGRLVSSFQLGDLACTVWDL